MNKSKDSPFFCFRPTIEEVKYKGKSFFVKIKPGEVWHRITFRMFLISYTRQEGIDNTSLKLILLFSVPSIYEYGGIQNSK